MFLTLLNSKLNNLAGSYVRGINRTTNSTGGLKITPTRSDQFITVFVTGPSNMFGMVGLAFYNGSFQYGTTFSENIKPIYSNGSVLIPVGGWAAGVGISYLNFSIEHYV